MENNKVQVKNNIGDVIISRINDLSECGFKMPKDYNYVNAIKMSMLQLQDLKDKEGKYALEVCDKNSIQSALFKMVTMGLNASLNQCYFIVRGGKLCMDISYYGKILMAKRINPSWTPMPVVIYEGDEFEYEIDNTTGRRYMVKHKQKIENTDKDFVGGYMYLPNGDLYTMTKKQIQTAWMKSSNKSLTIHKEFTDKMVKKTLVNTGLNVFINSSVEDYSDDTNEKENEEPNNTITEPEYEVLNEENNNLLENNNQEENKPVYTMPQEKKAEPVKKESKQEEDEDDF